MKQYCIYTQHPEFKDVINWIVLKELRNEVHLNRTRFWVPTGELHTEFVLRWFHCCSYVVDNEDYVLGHRATI